MLVKRLAAWRVGLHERFVRWALRVRSPEPAPIVLGQRRIYVLPTRAGLAYALVMVVILLGAMNYTLSLGYALVFLLGGLGVATIFQTFRNLVHVQLRPGRAEPVFAGDIAIFELLLENTRRAPRSCVRLLLAGTAQDIDIPARASMTVSLRLPAPQRGWLSMPRLTLESTWPLGLIRAWAYAAPDFRCLVYPQPAPAAATPPLPWRSDHAASMSSATRDGSGREDFSGLRTHQLSDPPRHVAWKAAARQSTLEAPLLTKLFSGAAAQRLWLDWDALPAALGVEQAVSVLARWMLMAEAAGLAWGLRLPGSQLEIASGAAQLAQGLRLLALYGDAEARRMTTKSDDGPP